MITVTHTTNDVLATRADAYIFLLGENFELTPTLQQLEKDHFPQLKLLLEKRGVKGRRGDCITLSFFKDNAYLQAVFLGVGNLQTDVDAVETVRRVLGTAVQMLKRLEAKSAMLDLSTITLTPAEEIIKQGVIALHLASFEFDLFKTDKKNKGFDATITLKVSPEAKAAEDAIRVASLIGSSMNEARLWADLPPNILTPTKFSEKVQQMAQENGLTCTVFGREKAKELSMGGFLAVASGSVEEPKFVIVEYKTTTPNAPTIALVGKGVMFDSGGLSLKPWTSMTGMKYDMSGAAAVFATMKILSQLKPAVNVVALAPLVENMPSGSSYRQDDIVTFMNGKTAEIQNTDAEGRIILADALCYAEKFYSPACIIDIATLTGACVIALGHSFTALLTRHEALATTLNTLGKQTGDKLWRLPLHDDFKLAIKSSVADIANSGKPGFGAGTITAALFLENFVEKTPWAHLDIAGTAHDVPDVSYLVGGTSGVGIRLFVEFVLTYKSL